MKYDANKIYKEVIYNKPGLLVVNEAEHGNLVHIDSGVWQDKQYKNIKMYEVFRARKKEKDLRLARKKLTAYDKKLCTTFYMARIQPEQLPKVAEMLIMLYNEIYGKEYKLETKGVVEKVQKKQDEMDELMKKAGRV